MKVDFSKDSPESIDAIRQIDSFMRGNKDAFGSKLKMISVENTKAYRYLRASVIKDFVLELNQLAIDIVEKITTDTINNELELVKSSLVILSKLFDCLDDLKQVVKDGVVRVDRNICDVYNNGFYRDFNTSYVFGGNSGLMLALADEKIASKVVNKIRDVVIPAQFQDIFDIKMVIGDVISDVSRLFPNFCFYIDCEDWEETPLLTNYIPIWFSLEIKKLYNVENIKKRDLINFLRVMSNDFSGGATNLVYEVPKNEFTKIKKIILPLKNNVDIDTIFNIINEECKK